MKPHHEHEFEAAPGLPEALPASIEIAAESPLWQPLVKRLEQHKQHEQHQQPRLKLHLVHQHSARQQPIRVSARRRGGGVI